jgi:hypothetical protein
MALHLQDQGSWKKADEVWVNDSDTWKQCNEVYIKENNAWKPVLYEPGSMYYTSSGSFTVPQGVFSITATVVGGAGGAGGGDGGAGSVGGGNGMTVTFSASVMPDDTFAFVIGEKGGDGAGYRGSASGGSGGNGYNSGGVGGRAGAHGSSGGGGGGGGSTSFYSNASSAMYIIAAGGSGAGGRGNRSHYSVADIHGKNATQTQSAASQGYDGGNGLSCPCADGGAGGGGGGGTESSAIGGLYYGNTTSCQHYDSDGMPGEAGVGYYNTGIVTSTQDINTGDGYVSISW